MKNLRKHLLITLSFAFLISSCTVQKRLHNPGYHVQLNKSHKIGKTIDNTLKVDEEIALTQTNSTVTILPELNQEFKETVATESSNEMTANYEVNQSDIASNDESISFQTVSSPKSNWIQEKHTSANQPEKVNSEELTNVNKKSNAANASAAGGVALLVLVILCLFPLINLIPVYITDGGITLNFWVTLILNLTYIGAVIFSLLVVLGIVSLA